ncbi:hypothetical protein C9415_27745 [Kluyvera sp. Nf5]|nr:hypothetical protein C9415_27745 [Kluyvera sp. Nf5]
MTEWASPQAAAQASRLRRVRTGEERQGVPIQGRRMTVLQQPDAAIARNRLYRRRMSMKTQNSAPALRGRERPVRAARPPDAASAPRTFAIGHQEQPETAQRVRRS